MKHEMMLLHDDLTTRMNVNTIDEEIEEALDLKIGDVKNLKEEFNSARGDDKSQEDATPRSKDQKKVSKKSSPHNPTEESG